MLQRELLWKKETMTRLEQAEFMTNVIRHHASQEDHESAHAEEDELLDLLVRAVLDRDHDAYGIALMCDEVSNMHFYRWHA